MWRINVFNVCKNEKEGCPSCECQFSKILYCHIIPRQEGDLKNNDDIYDMIENYFKNYNNHHDLSIGSIYWCNLKNKEMNYFENVLKSSLLDKAKVCEKEEIGSINTEEIQQLIKKHLEFIDNLHDSVFQKISWIFNKIKLIKIII